MQNTIYDVAIIGGGPAGIMAAISAAQNGKKVVILDKNQRLGRKLLLTGKGRCNITHDQQDPKIMIQKYNKESKFLLSAFSQFGIKETIEFFKSNGLNLKVERGSRYFPEAEDAESVLRLLENKLKELGVVVKYNSNVVKIYKTKNKIEKLLLKSEDEIFAKNYIIASGGCSYPATGSNGEIFNLIEKLGHKVTELKPALVGLKVKDAWVKSLSGLSLKNVEIKIKNTKTKNFGEMLLTHFGISGPIVLNISNEVVQLLKNGEVILVLDLKPALTNDVLDKRLQSDFQKYQNKNFKNSLYDLLPQKLADKIVDISLISETKKVNAVTKEERQKILKLIKGLEITINNHMGFDTAIVTSGGVCLKEINQRTMKSKIIENLSFAGEVLDIDGKTGGYNLQMCWTTGHVAGKNI